MIQKSCKERERGENEKRGRKKRERERKGKSKREKEKREREKIWGGKRGREFSFLFIQFFWEIMLFS